MNKERGQLLIESLVAITVISISLLGIFTLISRSLSLNRIVNNQYVGTYLAAEGIEVVKNIIDTNIIHDCEPWNAEPNAALTTAGDYAVEYDSTQLLPRQADPLSYDEGTGLYSYQSGGEESKFVRTVSIDPISSEHIKVVSLVEWDSRGGAEFSVELEDHFYQWRPTAANCGA